MGLVKRRKVFSFYSSCNLKTLSMTVWNANHSYTVDMGSHTSALMHMSHINASWTFAGTKVSAGMAPTLREVNLPRSKNVYPSA